jgi:dynein heavy chain
MPHEWIAFGETEDGGFNPICGKGLFRNSDGSAQWRSVLINSYDEERNVYTGYWDGTSEYVELTRINLLFNSEDPRIFAQRVAQAHSERIYADSQIRYNFFMDLMPQQELPELDSEQVSRILHHATASKYLRSRPNLETTAILFEV